MGYQPTLWRDCWGMFVRRSILASAFVIDVEEAELGDINSVTHLRGLLDREDFRPYGEGPFSALFPL